MENNNDHQEPSEEFSLDPNTQFELAELSRQHDEQVSLGLRRIIGPKDTVWVQPADYLADEYGFERWSAIQKLVSNEAFALFRMHDTIERTPVMDLFDRSPDLTLLDVIHDAEVGYFQKMHGRFLELLGIYHQTLSADHVEAFRSDMHAILNHDRRSWLHKIPPRETELRGSFNKALMELARHAARACLDPMRLALMEEIAKAEASKRQLQLFSAKKTDADIHISTPTSSAPAEPNDDDWYWFNICKKAKVLRHDNRLKQAEDSRETLRDYLITNRVQLPSNVKWCDKPGIGWRDAIGDELWHSNVKNWLTNKVRKCAHWISTNLGNAIPKGRRA